MNQTVDSRKYYPTALALYITYFVLGIAATIMGQYKQDFASLWGAAQLADGSFDVSGVVSVIAAIGLGRLIAFPIAGPLSDRLGRRLSGLIGCGLYAVFFLGITYAPNLYAGYVLAAVSGMTNSFLDTSITPSCMEIFKEKGAIANIFTKLSISIAQFLLPFAIRGAAARELPFHTIFLAAAAIIVIDGLFLAFLPFPPFVRAKKSEGAKEKLRLTPPAIFLILLGFTTSTTFMLWMNCNQELGGNFRIAAYPTGKGQLTEAVRSMIVRCENAGVDIRTGVEADEAVLKSLNPDAIILATGSTPLILRIPGLAECSYMTAQELLGGKRSAGRKALVVGGVMVGCEAAEFLAERGHEVSVIEMKDVIAADVTPESRRYMFETFREHNVGLYPGAKVGEFFTDGVDYTLADGTPGTLRGFDSIVLAMGSRSNAALKETAESVCSQVLVIGEAARAPGNAVTATTDALNAALAI